MILIKNLSSLVLIFCSLIRVNDAGCKYTNPMWVSDDPNFMTAPSLHLTFNGVNEEDLVWLSASWNLSYVEKYPQCIDSIQILVKKIKDSKTKKTLLCDIAKPTVMNCTGSLHRKDFCDETLDVWIRITNQDYKDGLQPIGAPSMTRVDNFQCGEPYNLEALGTFMKSQSCESLQPAWKSSPDFIIPEGIRSKRVVNMTWTNSLIENVICVDEVEIKYWEEGAFSKGYHKESVKIVNAGTEDYEYMIELDVTICKTYNYMMKAMKAEPYFVATYEGKFSSKCDESLLSQQQAAAATTRATTKAKTTTTTTTTTEVTEEPASPEESSSSTSEETVPEVDETSEEASKETTSATTSPSSASTSEAEDSETTASEDHKMTTSSETTHSTVATETTEGNDLDNNNNLDDDPKESVRSNVDSGITVPGETTISTTFSAAEMNATATEVEVNTSIITLTTAEIDSTDKDEHMEGKTGATEAETEGETTSGHTTGAETDTTAAETTAAETTLGETTHGDTTHADTTLGETTHGDTTLGETTHSETVTTAGTEASEDKTTAMELDKEAGRMDSVMKEKEVSLSFEVTNDTSSIEGSMIKRGRILMGDDSNDEQESSRSAEKARALQFNPWGKNSAEPMNTFRSSTTVVIAAATFLTLTLFA